MPMVSLAIKFRNSNLSLQAGNTLGTSLKRRVGDTGLTKSVMRIVFTYAWWLHAHSIITHTLMTAAVFNHSFSGLTLTSSVTGRHACLSEVVTFTCTARGHVIFWGNEEFGEITMHYQSPTSGGEFQAAVESYENNCLISTLTLHATASRNRTRVVCTNRGRTLSQSKSLHIMSTLLLFTFSGFSVGCCINREKVICYQLELELIIYYKYLKDCYVSTQQETCRVFWVFETLLSFLQFN